MPIRAVGIDLVGVESFAEQLGLGRLGVRRADLHGR